MYEIRFLWGAKCRCSDGWVAFCSVLTECSVVAAISYNVNLNNLLL